MSGYQEDALGRVGGVLSSQQMCLGRMYSVVIRWRTCRPKNNLFAHLRFTVTYTPALVWLLARDIRNMSRGHLNN